MLIVSSSLSMVPGPQQPSAKIDSGVQASRGHFSPVPASNAGHPCTSTVNDSPGATVAPRHGVFGANDDFQTFDRVEVDVTDALERHRHLDGLLNASGGQQHHRRQ